MIEETTHQHKEKGPKAQSQENLASASVAISPSGTLHADRGSKQEIAPDVAERTLRAFQAEGPAGAVLHLASKELSQDLPADLAFWRDLGRLFLAHLCAVPDLEEKRVALDLPAPAEELAALAQSAPPMRGGEYLSPALLERYWRDLVTEVQARLAAYKGSATDYLHALNPAWNSVGRVCFHLAENKQSDTRPFGFLATYTSRLSAKAKAQHIPLGRALEEYSGSGNKSALLNLLKPVKKAAENSPLLRALVDSGEIFHPLAWTADEAHRFLKDIPACEAAGVVVRVPDWWRAKRPPRPEVKVTVGKKSPSGLGLDALMDFRIDLSLGGEPLTAAEWRQIMKSTSSLVSIKGQWVEIDKEKLKEVLDHWHSVQESVGEDGVNFGEAMRMLAGASALGGGTTEASSNIDTKEWSSVVAGEWLQRTLAELRSPDAEGGEGPGSDLKATLRPYQLAGVKWLWMLHRLGLGACLADDMGLGKTVQVLALLLLLKRQRKNASSILVVPASLIGNWTAEAERFAPSLKLFILHPSALAVDMSDKKLRGLAAAADLTITTYGLLSRFEWLPDVNWTLAVLDEAQAIKNPGAKQTAAAKRLTASHRIALTGTPVENRISDLWSIFDFICPGLLGSTKAFNQFAKEPDNPYPAIRNLVRPYILRRLKTDKSIIADLPEKTEVRAFCALSKAQAGLYQQAVTELGKRIEEVDGIQRRGVILSFLMRFKQICNHPSQWLGDGAYDAKASGKFARLREICEEIAERQERVLVFTQFREMTGPLADFLAQIFGREGLVLHGETPVKQRKALVDAFQDDAGPPFFVLSLKAGGTGLNLTAASHVIHFDRWWNPAVENQATDRAFRIGQRKNVLVHKFICRGTVEEKVDAMIEDKKGMAAELLGSSSEAILTELNDTEILKLVALDIKTAVDGGCWAGRS